MSDTLPNTKKIDLVQEQGEMLLDAIAKLAAGQTDLDIEIPQGIDVMSDLAIAISFLAEDVANRIETQNKLLDELEMRVQERTQELEDAVDALQRSQQSYLRDEWHKYLEQPNNEFQNVDWIQSNHFKPAVEKTALEKIPALTPINGNGASALTVPINLADDLIGMLGFEGEELDSLSEDDLSAIEDIAEQVGLALENQRLFNQTQYALAETQDLYQVSAQLNAAETTKEILNAVVAVLIQSGIDFVTLWSIHGQPPSTESYMEKEESWASDADFHGYPVGYKAKFADALFFTSVAESRNYTFVESIQDDPLINFDQDMVVGLQQLGVNSFACLPLVVGTRLIGLFTISWKKPQIFTESDISRFRAIGTQLATSVDGLRLLGQTKRALAETQGLYEISAQLNAAESTRDILKAVVDAMADSNLDSARLWFTDPTDRESSWIEIIEVWNKSADPTTYDTGFKFDYSQSPFFCDLLQKKRQNALIESVIKDPIMKKDKILMEGAKSTGLNSVAYLPLLIGHRLVGLFVLGWKQARVFEKSDHQRFSAISAQIATAVDSVQLLDQTKRALSDTRGLYDFSAQLNAAESSTDIVQAVVNTMDATGIDSARLWFTESTEASNRWIQIAESWTRIVEETPRDPGSRFDYFTSPFLQQLLRDNRRNALISDITNEPLLEKDKVLSGRLESIGLKSAAYLPLVIGQRLVGLFVIGWKRPRSFDADDVQRFVAIAAQIATAVDSLQLLEQTRQSLFETENLYEISTRLNAAESVDDIMLSVIESRPADPIDSARLWMVDQRIDGELWLEVAGIWDREVSSNASQLGVRFECLDGSFFSNLLTDSREVALIESVKHNDSTKDDQTILQALEPDGINRLACLPLLLGNNLIALFGIGWKSSKSFEAGDKQRYSAIAAQLATSVNGLRLLDQTRQALTETQTLYQISAQLNASESTQDIMLAVVNAIEGMNIDGARLWRVEPLRDGKLWLEVLGNWSKEFEGSPEIGTRFDASVNSFLLNLLTESREVTLISSIKSDPRTKDNTDLIARVEPQGLTSFAYLPLMIGFRLIGLFVISWKEKQLFDDDDLQRFGAIGAQIATAIDGLQLLDQTQEALAETQALYQISALLNASESTKDILSAVTDTITDQAINEAILWRVEPLSDNDVRLRMIERWPDISTFDSSDDFFTYKVSEYPFLSGLIHESREVMFISSVQDDPRTSVDQNFVEMMDQVGMKSMIFLPLLIGNRLVGMLTLGWEELTTFNENDTQRYTAIGAQIATSVDSLRLLDQTQQALDETQALYQISARLNAAESAKEIVQSVVDTIQGREIDGARLWLVHTSSNKNWAIENIYSWFKNKNQDQMPLGSRLDLVDYPYIFELLRESREIRLVSSIQNDPNIKNYPDLLESLSQSGYSSMVFMPLLVGSKLVGLFTIGWNETQDFTNLEQQYYTAIGAQIATSVEGLRLLEDTRSRAAQLEKLAEIEAALSAATDENQILHAIAKEFPFARGGLHYIDSDKNNQPETVGTVAIYHKNKFAEEGTFAPPGLVTGFLANEIWLKRPSEVTIISNAFEHRQVTSDSKEIIKNMEATAFCVVPLVSGRQWQGLMTLSWQDEYELSDLEAFLLENLREPLGAIVARHRSQIAAQKARQESEQLYNVSSQLNQAASDLDSIVKVVADLAQPIGITQTVLVFTRLDRNGEAVGLEVSAAHSEADLEKFVEVGDRFGRSAYEQISTFKGAYFIENVEETTGLTTGTKRLLDQLASPAAGILPLDVGDSEVGFVFLLSDKPMEFEETSRRLFSSLAPQIAVAVQNSIFLADAQTRANREQMLRQISEKVRNTADVESVMRTAVTEIGRVLGRKTFLYLKSNDDDDTHTNMTR